MNEPWLVEASFDDRASDKSVALKRLVRKPVSFDGGGGTWMRDIGWTFATERAARAAALRLHRREGVAVIVRDLRSLRR